MSVSTSSSSSESSTDSNKINELPKHEIQWYGCIHDTPDHRDVMFKLEKPLKEIPPKKDLTVDDGGPDSKYPIQDQGELGSCTGNGIAAICAVCDIINDLKAGRTADKPFYPSRLFIYYNERVMENTINSDSGAMIRDGIKSVNKLGVCKESDHPYDIQKFTQRPNSQAYSNAKYHQALKYQRIPTGDLNTMKNCIVSGYPFTFGFTVYESFESKEVANTGIVPMPKPNERMLGGHCVVCVGYDDTKQLFKCRNSWGTDWGDKGYFYLPYEFMKNNQYVMDMW